MLWKMMHLLASQCDNNCLIMKQITSHALFQTLLLLVWTRVQGVSGVCITFPNDQNRSCNKCTWNDKWSNKARGKKLKAFCVIEQIECLRRFQMSCVQDCTSSPSKFLAKSSFYSCIGVFLEIWVKYVKNKICCQHPIFSDFVKIFWSH